jgi:hypothetical protein
MTGAWHITWIIWIIVGVIDQIVKLLFTLKASDNEIEDIENE